MGIVTATAPDCAHVVAWITPDTKVRLTLIPSSRCSLAAASIPDSVAGICFIFPCMVSSVPSQRRPWSASSLWLTATINISLLRPSFSKRATRLRALLQRASGSPSLRASRIVQWGPSTKFITAFPSSANYSCHSPRGDLTNLTRARGGGREKGRLGAQGCTLFSCRRACMQRVNGKTHELL
jgi:hypothetical protein